MNELITAISKRKEECIEKEMEALARLRGVPKQDINREELDRRIGRATEEEIAACTEGNREVSRPTFGAMPAIGDLQSVLEKRRRDMEEADQDLVIGD